MSDRTADLERAARAIEEFLDALGISRVGEPELVGTGRRVAEAYAQDLLSGYGMNPAEILAESTQSSERGLVLLSHVATTAMCPHHLLPATGVVHLGYWPGERVIGLGALGRLVDCYARRLVLQEDLGRHIVGAMIEHLGARAAGVMVDLSPACVTARGERRHEARATTVAFAGDARQSESMRSELLTAISISCTNHPSG